jgi:hypothetical protein
MMTNNKIFGGLIGIIAALQGTTLNCKAANLATQLEELCKEAEKLGNDTLAGDELKRAMNLYRSDGQPLDQEGAELGKIINIINGRQEFIASAIKDIQRIILQALQEKGKDKNEIDLNSELLELVANESNIEPTMNDIKEGLDSIKEKDRRKPATFYQNRRATQRIMTLALNLIGSRSANGSEDSSEIYEQRINELIYKSIIPLAKYRALLKATGKHEITGDPWFDWRTAMAVILLENAYQMEGDREESKDYQIGKEPERQSVMTIPEEGQASNGDKIQETKSKIPDNKTKSKQAGKLSQDQHHEERKAGKEAAQIGKKKNSSEQTILTTQQMTRKATKAIYAKIMQLYNRYPLRITTKIPSEALNSTWQIYETEAKKKGPGWLLNNNDSEAGIWALVGESKVLTIQTDSKKQRAIKLELERKEKSMKIKNISKITKILKEPENKMKINKAYETLLGGMGLLAPLTALIGSQTTEIQAATHYAAVDNAFKDDVDQLVAKLFMRAGSVDAPAYDASKAPDLAKNKPILVDMLNEVARALTNLSTLPQNEDPTDATHQILQRLSDPSAINPVKELEEKLEKLFIDETIGDTFGVSQNIASLETEAAARREYSKLLNLEDSKISTNAMINAIAEMTKIPIGDIAKSLPITSFYLSLIEANTGVDLNLIKDNLKICKGADVSTPERKAELDKSMASKLEIANSAYENLYSNGAENALKQVLPHATKELWILLTAAYACTGTDPKLDTVFYSEDTIKKSVESFITQQLTNNPTGLIDDLWKAATHTDQAGLGTPDAPNQVNIENMMKIKDNTMSCNAEQAKNLMSCRAIPHDLVKPTADWSAAVEALKNDPKKENLLSILSSAVKWGDLITRLDGDPMDAAFMAKNNRLDIIKTKAETIILPSGITMEPEVINDFILAGLAKKRASKTTPEDDLKAALDQIKTAIEDENEAISEIEIEVKKIKSLTKKFAQNYLFLPSKADKITIKLNHNEDDMTAALAAVPPDFTSINKISDDKWVDCINQQLAAPQEKKTLISDINKQYDQAINIMARLANPAPPEQSSLEDPKNLTGYVAQICQIIAQEAIKGPSGYDLTKHSALAKMIGKNTAKKVIKGEPAAIMTLGKMTGQTLISNFLNGLTPEAAIQTLTMIAQAANDRSDSAMEGSENAKFLIDFWQALCDPTRSLGRALASAKMIDIDGTLYSLTELQDAQRKLNKSGTSSTSDGTSKSKSFPSTIFPAPSTSPPLESITNPPYVKGPIDKNEDIKVFSNSPITTHYSAITKQFDKEAKEFISNELKELDGVELTEAGWEILKPYVTQIYAEISRYPVKDQITWMTTQKNLIDGKSDLKEAVALLKNDEINLNIATQVPDNDTAQVGEIFANPIKKDKLAALLAAARKKSFIDLLNTSSGLIDKIKERITIAGENGLTSDVLKQVCNLTTKHGLGSTALAIDKTEESQLTANNIAKINMDLTKELDSTSTDDDIKKEIIEIKAAVTTALELKNKKFAVDNDVVKAYKKIQGMGLSMITGKKIDKTAAKPTRLDLLIAILYTSGMKGSGETIRAEYINK